MDPVLNLDLSQLVVEKWDFLVCNCRWRYVIITIGLFTQPACLGGMHINDPAFSTSRTCNKMIFDAIMSHEEFCICDHTNPTRETKIELKPALCSSQQSTLESILTTLSSSKKHAVPKAAIEASPPFSCLTN